MLSKKFQVKISKVSIFKFSYFSYLHFTYSFHLKNFLKLNFSIMINDEINNIINLTFYYYVVTLLLYIYFIENIKTYIWIDISRSAFILCFS